MVQIYETFIPQIKFGEPNGLIRFTKIIYLQDDEATFTDLDGMRQQYLAEVAGLA